nr:MAG: hypothetical protein DIU57_13945 [Pseudomonadota bacterium]
MLAGFVSQVTAWASEGYRKNPAVMLGLLALVVLPVLAPIGLLLRRRPSIESRPVMALMPPVPQTLWIEIVGVPDSRRRLDHRLVRIGRQDDNDLCIKDATIHRYHAVIYPSPDEGLMIADLSGPEGNGVKVNGERVAQALLKPGDRLDLGRVELRIGAAD